MRPAKRSISPRCSAASSRFRAGDIVLLHACCHNPTGIDPTRGAVEANRRRVYERGALPLVDFAYQGFGDGLEEDAAGLRELARPGQGIAGLQFVLQELWPVQRTRRRADARGPQQPKRPKRR